MPFGPGTPGMPGMPGVRPLFPMPGIPPEEFQPPPADVSHIHRKWLDVAYAEVSSTQQLDIYLPEAGEGPFPIVIHIHGGAFAIGDKRDIQVVPFLGGLDLGYAVVGVNYRLSGEAVFPAGLQDVKAAIRWMKAHSGEYALDSDRIAVIGQSAGAHQAAMCCVTTGLGLFDDPSLGHAEYSSDVQVAVDMFGPTDFLKMDEHLAASGLGPCDHSQADSPESRYLGGRVTEIPEKAREANPTTYVHGGMPPILIQHGTRDCSVPVQQSIEFARAIEGRVGADRVELDIFEGAVHADPAFESDKNMARVFGFLDRHLRRASG
jgi:acetyl esterase/lipase